VGQSQTTANGGVSIGPISLLCAGVTPLPENLDINVQFSPNTNITDPGEIKIWDPVAEVYTAGPKMSSGKNTIQYNFLSPGSGQSVQIQAIITGIQTQAAGTAPGASPSPITFTVLNSNGQPVSNSVSLPPLTFSTNLGTLNLAPLNPVVSNLPGTSSVDVTIKGVTRDTLDLSSFLVSPRGASSTLDFFQPVQPGSDAPVAEGPQPEAIEASVIQLPIMPFTPGAQESPKGKKSSQNHHPGDAEASRKGAIGHLELAAFHAANALDAIPPGTLVRLAPPAESRPQASVQAAGQAATPISFSFVANGNPSGEAFELRIVDPSGKLKEIRAPDGLILEPLERGSAKPVSAAPGQKLVSQKFNAYCVKYDKDSPDPDGMYRVASPEIQEKYKPVRAVIRAGRELAAAGKFHPDSDPAAYIISIRQYALWTRLENWNEEKFSEVFREKTRQIAAQSKVEWTKELDQALRALVPGRWRDISLVLEEARKLEAADASPPR